MKEQLPRYRTALAAFVLALAAAVMTAHAEPASVLNIQQALDLAIQHNPDLAAVAAGVKAAEGDVRQAGAWLNPEMEIEAEDFAGTEGKESYDAATTTFRLSQQLELGGKRARRQSVAESEARLAVWDHETTKLDVVTRTKKAFVDVLVAQGRLDLAESALSVADDIHRVAGERVKAGKVSSLEETRAAVELSSARIARERAIRELQVAWQLLAVSWGSASAQFTRAAGTLESVKESPPPSVLEQAMEKAPDVARWHDEVAVAKGLLAVVRSGRVPDVAVSLGVSRYEEDGSHAGVASLSVPLPLFDRKTGGISAASYRLQRAEQAQRAARVRVTSELTDVTGRLETARAEALFEAIEAQGARLPSQRRYAARARSRERGIAVPRALYQEIQALAPAP